MCTPPMLRPCAIASRTVLLRARQQQSAVARSQSCIWARRTVAVHSHDPRDGVAPQTIVSLASSTAASALRPVDRRQHLSRVYAAAYAAKPNCSRPGPRLTRLPVGIQRPEPSAWQHRPQHRGTRYACRSCKSSRQEAQEERSGALRAALRSAPSGRPPLPQALRAPHSNGACCARSGMAGNSAEVANILSQIS